MAQLYAVVPTTQEFSDLGCVDISAFADRPLLLLRKGFMTRTLFDQACSQADVRPHTILESESTQTILSLADAGHGVAIVSSTAIVHRPPNPNSRVISLTVDGKPLGQMISAVWNPKRSRSTVLNPFLRELFSHIASSPAYSSLSPFKEGEFPVFSEKEEP